MRCSLRWPVEDDQPNHDRICHPIRVKRLSHIALGVRDLPRQTDFYVNACGHQIVEQAAENLYLRAAGNYHHVFESRASPCRIGSCR